MKNLFRLFIATIVAVIPLVGCETPSDKVAAPTIEIVAVATTENSLSFAVTATDASECAYMLYDGDIITAETVLSSGTAIDASGVVEVKNLKANTTYYVVAAARNANGESICPVMAIMVQPKR